MGDCQPISRDELPRRDGVDLVELAGMEAGWQMPVALWDAPRGFDTRRLPDHQPCHVIALRLSGSLVQRIGTGSGRPERLRPDGFSVHPARNELRFFAPSAIRFAHLYVSETFLHGVSGAVGSPRPTGSMAGDSQEIVPRDRVMYDDPALTREIAGYVRRAFDHADRPSKLEMESRANLIAIRFLGRHVAPPVPRQGRTSGTRLAPWQVRRVCSHLEANLDHDVSLAELAALVGISGEHLCRAFRRAVGVPPQRWLLHKRMEVACRLLRDSTASLTEIAQEVGYGGQSAFGVAFRSVVGVSPGQYRRGARGEAALLPPPAAYQPTL